MALSGKAAVPSLSCARWPPLPCRGGNPERSRHGRDPDGLHTSGFPVPASLCVRASSHPGPVLCGPVGVSPSRKSAPTHSDPHTARHAGMPMEAWALCMARPLLSPVLGSWRPARWAAAPCPASGETGLQGGSSLCSRQPWSSGGRAQSRAQAYPPTQHPGRQEVLPVGRAGPGDRLWAR